MRITVIGATGGTGLQLVQQAAAAGHDVTAAVRNPGVAPREWSGVRVVKADVADAHSLKEAVAGSDTVLSALGNRRGSHAPICGPSAAAVVHAMTDAGSRRLVVISAGGMHIDDGDSPLLRHLLKPALQRVLREDYADMAEMERVVSASELDWTIIWPVRLTDGPRTSRQRSQIGRNLRGGLSISRADLADAILKTIDNPETVRSSVAVAGG